MDTTSRPDRPEPPDRPDRAMSGTDRDPQQLFDLFAGTAVFATDGPAGVVADVVIDAAQRRITHLVVEPAHHHDRARLVPVSAVDLANSDRSGTHLTWSLAEVGSAPTVEETSVGTIGALPVPEPGWVIGTSRVVAAPPITDSGFGMGVAFDPSAAYGAPMVFVYDRIPEGCAEISHSCEVLSVDDHLVGHVDGFVIDRASGRISHVVVRHGHLWRRREVSIPVDSVERVATGIVRLRCSRAEVDSFPDLTADVTDDVDRSGNVDPVGTEVRP